jgi:hypothetical protein
LFAVVLGYLGKNIESFLDRLSKKPWRSVDEFEAVGAVFQVDFSA